MRFSPGCCCGCPDRCGGNPLPIGRSLYATFSISGYTYCPWDGMQIELPYLGYGTADPVVWPVVGEVYQWYNDSTVFSPCNETLHTYSSLRFIIGFFVDDRSIIGGVPGHCGCALLMPWAVEETVYTDGEPGTPFWCVSPVSSPGFDGNYTYVTWSPVGSFYGTSTVSSTSGHSCGCCNGSPTVVTLTDVP